MFTLTWGDDPILTNIVENGLEPPTSKRWMFLILLCRKKRSDLPLMGFPGFFRRLSWVSRAVMLPTMWCGSTDLPTPLGDLELR